MIRFKGVRKNFGRIIAVDDLTLDIQSGEVFGLLGPNGAGKTTTISMAVGLLQPDSGTVDVLNMGSPTQLKVRLKIGMAPQQLAIYEDLTAEENLMFFGALHALRGSVLKIRVAESLDFVGLTDRRRDRVKTFSGGMKRRLNLAIALVHEPSMVLLDEPTAGVDPQSRNAVFDNILELRKKGVTIVYTTHYMEEAEKLCNRVGILDHGKLLALGTVAELISTYGGKSVLTAERAEGGVQIATNDPMGELLKLQESGQLIRFKVDSPDLESVFLNLTGRKLRN